MTEALKKFQREHFNHLGKRLLDDGVLGPQTKWALDMATLCPRRQLICRRAIACLQVGIDESAGANVHPIISLFLLRCNTVEEQAWCAAMASDCLGDVAIPGAIDLLNHFPETDNPMPGDLYGFATGPWQGHVGIVGGRTLSEVFGWEGNSRNMARAVRRKRGGPLRFSRTYHDVSGNCPGIPPGVPFEETRASAEGTR